MTITAPPSRGRRRTVPNTQPRAQSAGQPQAARARSAPPETGSGQRKSRSAASQRAYDRKAQRQSVLTADRRPPVPRRTPFVLLVMGMLAVGLISSLWLSTVASADSYRLEQAQLQARNLSERSEQLRQEVASLQTAPELAKRARQLGLVPSPEPARLVVRPDGTVQVVGKPAAAVGPAPSGTALRADQQPGADAAQPSSPAPQPSAPPSPSVQASPVQPSPVQPSPAPQSPGQASPTPSTPSPGLPARSPAQTRPAENQPAGGG